MLEKEETLSYHATRWADLSTSIILLSEIKKINIVKIDQSRWKRPPPLLFVCHFPVSRVRNLSTSALAALGKDPSDSSYRKPRPKATAGIAEGP